MEADNDHRRKAVSRILYFGSALDSLPLKEYDSLRL